MKLVKNLIEMSIHEAFGACDYARDAILNKTDDPNIAGMFATMAEQELQHSETLYTHASQLLEKHKDHEQYPAYKMLLDFTREMQIDTVNDTKRYLAQYKGA